MTNPKEIYDIIDSGNFAEDPNSFDDREKLTIGHLLKLSFPSCGKELVADLAILDPEDLDRKVKAAGIFDYVQWCGASNDPILLGFRISPQNKAIIQEALISLMDNSSEMEMEMEWIVYQYDYHNGKYFKFFHTDKKLVKFTFENGRKVRLGDHVSYRGFPKIGMRCDMSLLPKSGLDQELHFAFSTNGTKFSRKIGNPELQTSL